MSRMPRPGQVLILGLREAGAQRPSSAFEAAVADVNLGSLVDEAIRQRVGGALLDSLARTSWRDDPEVARLRDWTTHQVAWQMFASAQMHSVVAALDSQQLPHAVLKGLVLADHVYPSPTWRAFVDVDVLVASSDAPRARAAIERLGGAVPDVQHELTRQGFDGEIAIFMHGGLNLDLHHELVNDHEIRRHFRVPVGELLARPREISVAGGSIRTLDATDQLLHLCLHAGISNGRKLVWLFDIDQAIRRDPPDLGRLVERARVWRVGLPTAVMLERARRTLQTPVEDDLLDALAPRGLWRRFCRAILALRPPETAADAVLGGGLVVAATRESDLASYRALGRAVWQSGVVSPIVNPAHPWRRRAPSLSARRVVKPQERPLP
jgi:hypothetical protein